VSLLNTIIKSKNQNIKLQEKQTQPEMKPQKEQGKK
jgi:hypothetical protein